MKFFINYLKQHRMGIIAFFLFCSVFAVVFYLYDISLGAVIYPALISALAGLILIIFDCRKAYKKHKALKEISALSSELISSLPSPENAVDRDYQLIINSLIAQQQELRDKADIRFNDMIDYYTTWAHQIKTPIASMRLNLQNEDSEFSRKISDDLFRIEQYAEMVLCYLRLDSNSTDYVIAEQNLDKIIKQTVKKFAGQFIRRKISLSYEPLNLKVLTDEKWLSFVLEQIISNALKYTPSGSISVYIENSYTLCIADTGIGIASEDLPRIFEKGYTGYNGRNDKKASGIGLYLSKRICNNLGHKIWAVSSPGNGTVIKIDLKKADLQTE